MSARFLKIIACEIAFREICHVAARSPNLLDLEFLTQGLHDTPCAGRGEIQRRIDAVPRAVEVSKEVPQLTPLGVLHVTTAKN